MTATRTPLTALQANFAEWRRQARIEGFKGTNADFRQACQAHMQGEPTPEAWVAAAENVHWDNYVESHFDELMGDGDDDDYYEPEGPGITEPWECAYGPREVAF